MTSLISADIFNAAFQDCSTQKEQNIIRTAHDRNNPYSIISNKLLRDTSIRHSDRGLMCQLLSWSDYHRLCIQAVVKKSVEGRDAIRGMIDRLIKAGYIRMSQAKSVNGQFSTVSYQIFEESTGAVVADLDLEGIVCDDPFEQLDLFDDAVIENNMINVKQSANVKPVAGKHDTNNNYDLRNTNSSSNKVNAEILKNENKNEDPATLLKKWHLKMDNPTFKYKVNISGLSMFLISQEQLDRYLIDFNQQHEKYKNLSETKRVHNFVVYLIRLKNTKQEYAKHVARMKALGLDVYTPKKSTEKKQKNEQRVTEQQTGCNPFVVSVSSQAIEVSEDFKKNMEGF